MAIKIETRQAKHSLIGKSHWWGAPDLPKDQPFPYEMVRDGEDEYPEPLTFVCQIRLRDIAELDPEGLLPHHGMLYFFAPLDYHLGNLDSPLDHHTSPVVIYSEEENDLEPYEMHWEGTEESIFEPAEEIVFSKADGSGDGHRMLCRPYQDEVVDEHPDHICLLQIDEDDRWELRFYDCGMYFFLIPQTALKNRLWHKASGTLFYY